MIIAKYMPNKRRVIVPELYGQNGRINGGSRGCIRVYVRTRQEASAVRDRGENMADYGIIERSYMQRD